eukprot:Amastigsp_a676229_50.p3 type:complete len:129 gc:universal Amastigsp_a676229_50:530-144(-)
MRCRPAVAPPAKCGRTSIGTCPRRPSLSRSQRRCKPRASTTTPRRAPLSRTVCSTRGWATPCAPSNSAPLWSTWKSTSSSRRSRASAKSFALDSPSSLPATRACSLLPVGRAPTARSTCRLRRSVTRS